MEMNIKASDLLSVRQAAAVLDKPPLTIYRWVEKKKIISIKLGGTIFIPKSEVDRIIGAKIDG